MTTEEKAKRYDELFVKASRIYIKENDVLIMHTIEDLFPELKESGDERIRKWLICTLKSLNSSPVQIDGAYEMMLPAIAWLEKQGRKPQWKPSDEQMKLLREVQQALLGKDCHNRFVNFMYELKRLREE